MATATCPTCIKWPRWRGERCFTHLTMTTSRSITLLLLVVAHIAANERVSLRGKHLIAGTGHYISTLEMHRNSTGHVKYTGHLFELFDWLSRRTHFTYTLVPAKENIPGLLVNGTWRGLIGLLLTKDIDIAIGPIALSMERFKVVNFAALTGGAGSTLLIKYPGKRISKHAVLEPFDLSVWIYWIASFIAVYCSGYLILKWALQFTKIQPSGSFVMYVLGTITGQGSFYQMRARPVQLLAAVWCLTATVFVNVYGSVLISFLSAQYKLPEVNSMGQLAGKEQYQLLTLKGSVAELDILGSTRSTYKVLANKLLECPQCRSSEPNDVAKWVMEEEFVAFIPDQVSQALMSRDLQVTGKCRLTIAHEKYQWYHMYYAIDKSSPFMEELNREALWAHAMGLTNKWTSSAKFPRRCLLKYTSRGAAVEKSSFPLRLQQLYVAFFILIFGCVVAALSFVIELVR